MALTAALIGSLLALTSPVAALASGTASITGTILTAEGEAPATVIDYWVTLADQQGDYWADVTPSTDGTYIFDNLDTGTYRLTVSHPHHPGHKADITITSDGQAIQHDVALRTGYSLSGYVTNGETDEPIPGLRVSVWTPDGTEDTGRGTRTESTETDVNGHYEFRGLLSNPSWTIHTGNPKAGYEIVTDTVALVGENLNHELNLHPAPHPLTSSIAGIVLDSTTELPLEGVSVTSYEDGIDTTTDEHGRYLIEHLAEASYYLGYALDGYSTESVQITTIQDESYEHDPIYLRPLDSEISGLVTDTDNNPLPDVEVHASEIIQGPWSSPGGSAMTGPDGRYVITGIPSASYTVTIGGAYTPWTYQQISPVTVSAAAPRNDVDFTLTPRLTGTVNATYTDPLTGDGIPLDSVDIVLEPLDPDAELAAVYYEGNGHGSNNDVPVGEYLGRVVYGGPTGMSDRYAEEYLRDPLAPHHGVGLDPTGALTITVTEGDTVELEFTTTRGVQIFADFKLRIGAQLVDVVKVPTSTLFQQHLDGSWNELPITNSFIGGALADNEFSKLHPQGKYRLGHIIGTGPRSYAEVYWDGIAWGGTTNFDDAATIDFTDIATTTPAHVSMTLEYRRPGSTPVAVTELIEDARDGITADGAVQLGGQTTVQLDPELAGEWVSLWAHSTPTLLSAGDGWQQVEADGSVTVDIPTNLPPGEHHLVTQLADGSLLGWTKVDAVESLDGVGGTAAVLGDAEVGQRLITQVGGEWDPFPTSFSYQWYSNGKKISKATKSHYVVSSSQVGKTLTVKITGKGPGKISQSTVVGHPDPVVAGTFTTAPDPTITGTTVVGKTLKVTAGTWKPKASLKYQWFADGVPINKATKSSFKLTSAQLDSIITVEVTGTAKGYNSLLRESAPTTAVLGALSKVPTPKLSGSARVDSTLTVKPATVEGATPSYQWYTVKGKSRTPIAGATDASYTLTAAERGKKVSATVTWERTGYATVTKNSSASKTIDYGATMTVPKPVIEGSAEITRPDTSLVFPVLTAAQAAVTPATAAISYQWLRGGKAIAGATEASYTVTQWDAGQKISVRTTATLPGYKSRSATSTTVTPTITAAPFGAGGFVVVGAPTVAATLGIAGDGIWESTTDPGTYLVPTSFSFQWRINGKAVSKATGTNWVVTASSVGKTVSVTITANLTTEAGTKVKKQSQTVQLGTAIETSSFAVDSSKSITITGEATVGKTLKVAVPKDRYSPAPSKYSYQWQRWDGAWVPIPGATKSSYKLTASDVLHDLTVKVTAKRSGYTDNVTEADHVGPVLDGMTSVPTPKISGTARVGETLTVNPGTVTGATPSYQWHTVNGKTLTAIDGATSNTYTLTAAERGSKIRVSVTWTKPQYTPVTKASAATAKSVATGTITTTAPLTIGGSPELGETLAIAASVDPGDSELGYQWFADGVELSVTGPTLTLDATHLGKTVTAKVTISKAGYKTVTKTLKGGKVTLP